MAAIGMAGKSLYRCGTGHSSDLTTSGKEHIIRDRKGAAGRRLPFKNVWLRNSRSFLQDGAVISFDRKTGKPTPQCQSVPSNREWILSTLCCFILFCGLQKACTATTSRPFMIQDSKKAAKSCGFFPIDKKPALLNRGLVTERSLEGFPFLSANFFTGLWTDSP